MNIDIYLAVFGAIATLYGAFLTWKYRRKNKLIIYVYNYYSSTYVLDDIENDIKILYKDQEVSEMNLIELLFYNAGNTVIEGRRILNDKPIIFKTNDEYRIYDFRVIELGRQGIEPTLLWMSENSVELKFELLKPKESIRIQLYTDCEIEDLLVKGRIEEFVHMNELGYNYNIDKIKISKYNIRTFIFCLLVSMFFAFIAIYNFNERLLTLQNENTIRVAFESKDDSTQDRSFFSLFFNRDSLYYQNVYGLPDSVIVQGFLDEDVFNNRSIYLYNRLDLRTYRMSNVRENYYELDFVMFFIMPLVAGFGFVFYFIAFIYYSALLKRGYGLMTVDERLEILPRYIQNIVLKHRYQKEQKYERKNAEDA